MYGACVDCWHSNATLVCTGGRLVIFGEYIGTKAQVDAGNVTVQVLHPDLRVLDQCANVSSIVDDAVLQCKYPDVGSIAGIDLPVRVCVKDPSTPASDWYSNTNVVLSYAKEIVEQAVIVRVKSRDGRPQGYDAGTLAAEVPGNESQVRC